MMTRFKERRYSVSDHHIFLRFLSELNGFLCKAKILHWAAKGKDIHEYLDDYHKVLGDFQDALAEGYMGILGQITADEVGYVECLEEDPKRFIESVLSSALNFYNQIPGGAEFKGISGETESFIQDTQKYKYLFGLCH